MQEACLIFPHQLFEEHPCLNKNIPVILVEEALFFHLYKFHKQKLQLHRASMQYYKDWLEQKGYKVQYVESIQSHCDIRHLIPQLHQQGVQRIHFTAVADNWLRRRIQSSCKACNMEINEVDSPGFLNSVHEINTYFGNKKTYFQTSFYIDQRKKRQLLIEANNQPVGGQWSFDAANREKYPKKLLPPVVKKPAAGSYTKEAHAYVGKHFANHYGEDMNCLYPVTHAAAAKWLDDFLEQRFHDFGIYEDAIVFNEHFLHHSVLTPMLNTGLLTPQQVLDKTLEYAAQKQVPLNSLEGFIRQITGWREFIRAVYERAGSQQRTRNYWGFKRRIPLSFWQGNTGIFPVDNVIQKVLRTGYSHHIERLMVMGNFMLLCEFDPDEVYRWFMEMYVDAYDWVMVPNVYGMTQFADGGLMTTKPYISGSNYLLKMSDYPKGEWTVIWDALFWRFMHVHRSFFLQNPRLGMLIKTFDKMPEEKQGFHLDTAEKFLHQLDSSK